MNIDIKITDADLPTLSVVATQALTLINDENVTNAKIEALIRQDVALSQRILTVANSPFYSGRQASQSISGAIMRLGLRQLRTVIVMAATGELFNADDPLVHLIWDHSLATAIAAHQLATDLKLPDVEEAFIGGILHDVGKLVVYHQHPEPYGATLRRAQELGLRSTAAEGADYGFFTHETVGGLVVKKWKLSDGLAECARHHHAVESAVPPILEQPQLVCVVSLASVIANNLGHGTKVCEWSDVPALACAQEIGFGADRIEKLCEKVNTLLESQRPASQPAR